jgi:hypothetical protein
VTIVDPRGVGQLRDLRVVPGHDYADPLTGVEENLAYNAFLVGRSLLGMRVTDVLSAIDTVISRIAPQRIILCGRRDAGLVAILAAAVEPRINLVAVEETRLSYLPLFAPEGMPINASEIAPGLLRDFGDIPDVLAHIAPRGVLAAACSGKLTRRIDSARLVSDRFTRNVQVLAAWLE